MTSSTAPIEVSVPIAASISRVVLEFAAKAGLQDVHWYHDAPVWFVEQREKDLVRRVQISPHRMKPDAPWLVTLRLIPEVYRVGNARVVATLPSSAIRKGIRSVEIYRSVDGHVNMVPQEELASALWSELEQAWQSALRMPSP